MILIASSGLCKMIADVRFFLSHREKLIEGLDIPDHCSIFISFLVDKAVNYESPKS
jgi:hypothetical protein